MAGLSAIFWLGTKELRSLAHDWALLGFVVYSFTIAIQSQAQSQQQELHNAAVAIVDEDRSALSRAIAHALLPPYFQPPQDIAAGDVDAAMNVGRYTFVLDIPPRFQRDVLAGRSPALQLAVDATAMMQAGIGAGYVESIIQGEVRHLAARTDAPAPAPVDLAVRIAFNPNITTAWFTSVMGIVNNVTMLAVILAGAAVIREREHGTMDHLLTMPLTPVEIALAKVWSNGLVILALVALSLWGIVERWLGVPIQGSIPLFLGATAVYLFFATAIGLLLGTIARSMPQLGLLFILVAVPLNLLSGGSTPVESMPEALQAIMSASPSTHFVSVAEAILYRGAGLDAVWQHGLVMAGVGGLLFALAVLRFRATAATLAGS